MTNHGLNDKQLATIRQILAPFATQIERVGLFGSRATGRYRSDSDIDMVLYGTLDEKTVDRIITLFNESSLPMKVDIQAYHLITYPPLKAHIDAVMLPLPVLTDTR
jgi:predicted nucleotidyltransferase